MTPRHAPGVVYSTLSDLPGVEMFRCDRWRATISVSSCARRWQGQRDADVENRDVCHGCGLGVLHSAEQPDRRSKIFGWPICPRCRRRSTRMIGGLRCVSCYNRQREFLSGRNAKGTPPSIVLKPARIGLVIHPGEASEVLVDVAEVAVLDSVELAVAAMRVVDGAVVITRPRGGATIDVAELRRRHGKKRKPRKPMPRRRVGARAVAGLGATWWLQRRAVLGPAPKLRYPQKRRLSVG